MLPKGGNPWDGKRAPGVLNTFVVFFLFFHLALRFWNHTCELTIYCSYHLVSVLRILIYINTFKSYKRDISSLRSVLIHFTSLEYDDIVEAKLFCDLLLIQANHLQDPLNEFIRFPHENMKRVLKYKQSVETLLYFIISIGTKFELKMMVAFVAEFSHTS
jgi:hypothetical protein